MPTVAMQQISYEININISGTIVVEQANAFNQGESYGRIFGDIRFSSTSNELGRTYIEPLVSDMTCSGDSAGSAAMKLSSKDGSSQDYNGNKLLKVGIEGEGGRHQDLGSHLK